MADGGSPRIRTPAIFHRRGAVSSVGLTGRKDLRVARRMMKGAPARTGSPSGARAGGLRSAAVRRSLRGRVGPGRAEARVPGASVVIMSDRGVVDSAVIISFNWDAALLEGIWCRRRSGVSRRGAGARTSSRRAVSSGARPP